MVLLKTVSVGELVYLGGGVDLFQANGKGLRDPHILHPLNRDLLELGTV